MSRVHAAVPIHIILLILLAFLFTSSIKQHEVEGDLIVQDQSTLAGMSNMLFNEKDDQIYSDKNDSLGLTSLTYQDKPEPKTQQTAFIESQVIYHNGTAIVEVKNPVTGRVWMDRNLGASRTATSSTDSLAFGDLYQWGRAADGHQKRNSPTTDTLSSSNQPGHGAFIKSNHDANWEWHSPHNFDLWQGEDGVNNPCPPGYRLPTEAEWQKEIQSWSSRDEAGAFASPLKLPMAGFRHYSSGSLGDVGSGGYYWSSTVSLTRARRLYFWGNSANIGGYRQAFGRSVRCIKDY